MTFRRARPRFLADFASCALAAACALAPACSGETPPPHGSPVLTQVFWVAGGQPLLAWSYRCDATYCDAAFRSPVPPFASEVDFVFDRRLDGTRLEDITTVNGVTISTPKDPPAVRVSWEDMATRMSDPPFGMVIHYNSAPQFGGNSSYVFARPDEPGFPASSTIHFDLDASRFTSEYGEPATLGAFPIDVKTSGFTVSIDAATTPVVRSYQLPLTFTNRVPAPPATSPFVHVRVGGADVPYKLLGDASLASRWYVAPADCLGGWPASTTFTVQVDADVVDAFGSPLSAAATATFSTGANATGGTATCSIPDAGAPDGAVEAGVGASDAGDGPASDATPDGGAPDGAGPDTAPEAGDAGDDAGTPSDAGAADSAEAGAADGADAADAA
jgi:hypothetical protein